VLKAEVVDSLVEEVGALLWSGNMVKKRGGTTLSVPVIKSLNPGGGWGKRSLILELETHAGAGL